MRKNRSFIIIIVMAVVMLLLILRFLFVRESPLMELIEFQETVYGQSLEPYYDEDEDTYYLFLPAYAEKEDISVSSPESVSFDISDDTNDYKDDLEDAPLKENLTISVQNFYENESFNLQIWQYDNLPTVYIETASGSMDQINEDKDYEEDATALFIDADGTIELENMCTLTGRGNASWTGSKKPYNLKFSSGVSVGPFEDINTLCLLSNYSDDTRIRNAICYYAAEELDFPYSSPYMCVDVYANGEFLGLYGIATKEAYEKYIDKDQIQAVFETNTNTETELDLDDRCRILYGDKEAVYDTIEKLENALTTENWEACDSIIDRYSFAKRYAFEEFIANHDFPRGSSYQSKFFYIDKDDVLHCMLPWDYDWTLGASRTYFNNYQVYELKTYRGPNSWFTLLLDYDDYVEDVVKVLKEDFTDAYIDDLMGYIEWLTTYTEQSWKCDQIRWQDESPYSGPWDLSSGMEDLPDYIAYYRSYFPERRAFLIDCLSDLDEYCRVEFSSTFDAVYSTTPEYSNIMIPKGENLEDYIEGANILRTDRRPGRNFSGWYTEDGTSVYDIGAVTEDLAFTGKWTLKGSEDASDTAAAAGETSIFQNLRKWIRRIERRIGLNSFGWVRLIICLIFGLILIGLIVREIRLRIQDKRESNKRNNR